MQTEGAATQGAPGEGGIGGDGDLTVKGEPGRACKTLDFDTADCVE
jgi:hypothetical protein